MIINRQQIRLFLMLFIFWLALCGEISVTLIGLGLFASACSVYLSEKLMKTSGIIPFPPLPRINWFHYLGLLIQFMAKNTYLHIKRLGEIDEDISYLTYKLSVKHPVSRLLIANAITLSPGMMSVTIEKDLLQVICYASSTRTNDKLILSYLNKLETLFKEVTT